MPHSGGSVTPDSTSARRCTGVVASRRGCGVSVSTRATSCGKNGRAACTHAGPSSGSSTDSSMPYMCCGGTVATTHGGVSCQRLCKAARFCPVLARNAGPGFRVGLWMAGAARREADSDDGCIVDRRGFADPLRQRCGQPPVMRRLQRQRAVAQTVAVRIARQHIADHGRRARRRQQRDLPAQRDRAERHQKAVAVVAQIDRVPARRQQRGHAPHLSQKSLQRDALAVFHGDAALCVAHGQRLQPGRYAGGLDDGRHYAGCSPGEGPQPGARGRRQGRKIVSQIPE